MKFSPFVYCIVATVSVIVSACGQNPYTNQAQSTTTTGTTPYIQSSNYSPPIGATITLTGQGGTGPYTFSILSGGGQFTSNANSTGSTNYLAPAAVGAVSIGIRDSAGSNGSLDLTVVTGTTGSSVLTISPQTPQIAPGGTVNFVVSGGTPPYTYTIAGGSTNGTMTNEADTTSPAQGTATFTASSSQGTVQITIGDSAQTTDSSTVSVQVQGNFNTTALNQTFQVYADPYVGFSFDGTNTTLAPYLGFLDEGPNLDAASVGLGGTNCTQNGAFAPPCYSGLGLTNFDPNVGAGVSYRGTVTVQGPTATDEVSFCIPPVHSRYAFIKTVQGTYSGFGITFDAAGKVLFEQLATTSVFFYVNANSATQGAQLANVTVTGAYDSTNVGCSDYDGTQYVNVGM